MGRRNAGSGAQLSDLAFLLILFFMILAGTMGLGSIGAALDASGAQTDAPQDQRVLQIMIDVDGAWSLDAQPADRQYIKGLLDTGGEQVKLIIDEHAPWQSVLELLDIIRHYDAASVSMEQL